MADLERPKTPEEPKNLERNELNTQLYRKVLGEDPAKKLESDGVEGTKEVLQRFSHVLKELKENPKLLNKVSPRLVEHLARAMKQDAKEKEKRGQFPAIYEAKLDHMELENKADLFVVTTNKKFSSGDAAFKDFEQETQKIFSNYITLDPKQQLAVAASLKEKWAFGGDPELLRKMIVVNVKTSDDIAQMRMAVKDKKFMSEYQKRVERGEDSAKAFDESLKSGSPELQKSFQNYSRKWESAQVYDVFPKEPKSVAGVKVEVPSSDDVKNTAVAYQQEGVRINMSPDSHTGIVHVGADIMREVAIYIVDGSPKLFVYDRNADEGVRGPIDSKKAKEVFFEMSIDDYFSKKFREFATFDSEKDPTKVSDSKLFKMAHTFFPESELNKIALDVRTRQLLDNLAYLCVTTDEHYLAMGKKIEFLDRVANDPLAAYAAKKILSERNFVKTRGTLSVFEEELKRKRPQFFDR